MRKYLLSTAIAAGLAGAVLAPPSANATLQLFAVFNGVTFQCADGQACDTNGATGILQVADQTIGGIQVNGSIQTASGTVLNPGPLAILNTSSLSIINNAGKAVDVALVVSATDFIGPVQSFVTTTGGSMQLGVGGNITTSFYDDPENQQGADAINDTPGDLIDTFSKTFTLPAQSFAHDGAGVVNDPGNFSMTQLITSHLPTGASLLNRGSTEIKEAPEPATLAVFGAGLLIMGAIGRRRSRS